MCLIIAKPKGTDLPKESYLKHAAKRNSDGQGLAYLKKGEHLIKLKKDFKDVDSLIDFINKNITKEDDLIIHFRLATHGLVDAGNCHPFPITKNKTLLRKTELECKHIVAHNGVLTQYGKVEDIELSDSQRFILDVLSESAIKENLDKSGVQVLINEFLNGDRLVTLNNKGEMLLFGDFKEEDGISYSNSMYKPIITYINYNRTAEYENGHWMGYGFNHQSSPHIGKNTKQNQNEGANITGHCEGCNKWKKLKISDYKDKKYILCKRCRKKAKKNKLNLYIETKKKGLDVETFLKESLENEKGIHPCHSCRVDYPVEELELVMGTSLVCPSCVSKMKNDPEQSVLFDTVD